MSLANIRSYLKERLDGLGYEEWRDGFPDSLNIPETVIDKSYHILVSRVGGGPINHTHQDTFSNVSVKVYFKGYRDVTEAIDTAILGVETIIKDVCKVANRTSSVFNVIFEGADFTPQTDAQDNSVLVDVGFTVQVILGVEE